MKEYLEKTLRQHVMMTEDTDVYQKLPLAFRGRYSIFRIESGGVLWTAIYPKGEAGLVVIRKDRLRVEQVTGLNCAVFLEHTTFYIREKMLEEGIPFVIKGKQIYLPFIGYLLSSRNEREIPPVHMISFLTQKMLLMAIYGNWKEVKVSDAAEILGVSKKSVSRCFDELEILNIDVLGMKGKSRIINIPENKKQLWEDIKEKLRNPVIRSFVLSKDIELSKKAGISALCDLSLLADNNYPTYAVTKKEIEASGVKKERQIDLYDEIGCVVLELGYFIDYNGDGIQDPFSIALAMSKEEIEDERVKISIDEMLGEFVWLKD